MQRFRWSAISPGCLAPNYLIPVKAIASLEVSLTRWIFLSLYTEKTWLNVTKQHRAKCRLLAHMGSQPPVEPGFFSSSSTMPVPIALVMPSMNSSVVGNLPRVCWRASAFSLISSTPYWPVRVLLRVGFSPIHDFVIVAKASSLKPSFWFISGTAGMSNTN